MMGVYWRALQDLLTGSKPWREGYTMGGAYWQARTHIVAFLSALCLVALIASFVAIGFEFGRHAK